MTGCPDERQVPVDTPCRRTVIPFSPTYVTIKSEALLIAAAREALHLPRKCAAYASTGTTACRTRCTVFVLHPSRSATLRIDLPSFNSSAMCECSASLVARPL
jgi:hypothetical protein